jgi:hypothetical protein
MTLALQMDKFGDGFRPNEGTVAVEQSLRFSIDAVSIRHTGYHSIDDFDISRE